MPRSIVKGKRSKAEANARKLDYAPRKVIKVVAKSDDIDGQGRGFAKITTGAAFAAFE